MRQGSVPYIVRVLDNTEQHQTIPNLEHEAARDDLLPPFNLQCRKGACLQDDLHTFVCSKT